MSKTAVVILNWNGWKDTIECLKSIDEQEKRNKKLEIIIVDNASTNDSVQKIKDFFNHQSLTIKHLLLVNEQNLGFAGGNNVGIAFALKNKFDYIFILNNDTEIGEKAISKLIKFMEENIDIGAASPKIYFAPRFEFHKKRYKKSELGKVIWYAGGDMDWSNVLGSNHGVDKVDKGQFDKVVDTDFVTGAAMILRASVLKQVGSFNKKYFLYFEDTDLSLRIKKAGFAVVYFPDSKIWHKVSRSSAIGSDLNDYFITRNRLLLAINWAPLRAKIAVIKESIFFITKFGRKWQVKGAMDFYLRRFGKGSWK